MNRSIIENFIECLNKVCEAKETNKVQIQKSKMMLLKSLQYLQPQYLLDQIIPRINQNIKTGAFEKVRAQQTKKLIQQHAKGLKFKKHKYIIEQCQNNQQRQQIQTDFIRLKSFFKGFLLILNVKMKRIRLQKDFNIWRNKTFSSKPPIYDTSELTQSQIAFLEQNINNQNKDNIYESIRGIKDIVNQNYITKRQVLQQWKNITEGYKLQNFINKFKVANNLLDKIEKSFSNVKNDVFMTLKYPIMFEKFENKMEIIKKKKEQLSLNILKKQTYQMISRNKKKAISFQNGLNDTIFKKIKQIYKHMFNKLRSPFMNKKKLNSCFIKILSSCIYRNYMSSFDNLKNYKLKSKMMLPILVSECLIRKENNLKKMVCERLRNDVKKLRKMLQALRHQHSTTLNYALKIWFENTVGLVRKKLKLRTQFKAYILMKCYKIGSNLNLKRAFLRWNVWGIKIFPKQALQKFALYGRISKETFLWRIKKVFLKKSPIKKNRQMLLVRMLMTFQQFCFRIKRNAIFEMSASLQTKELKRQYLLNLNEILKQQLENRIRNVVRMFIKITGDQILRRKYMTKILTGKFGKILLLFNTWKSLPNVVNKFNIVKANKFQDGLKSMIFRNQTQCLRGFQNIYYEGQSKKKFCLKKLIYFSMSQQKRKFLFWEKTTSRDKILRLSKEISHFMFNLQNLIKLNSNIFQNPHQVRIKQKALQKLFKNATHNTMNACNHWKQNVRIMKIKQQLTYQKKKSCLEIMENAVQGGLRKQIKDNLEKLFKNSRIVQIQRQFFLKILQTKGGRAALAFKIWKDIPEIINIGKIRLANKFERKLLNFINRELKKTYSEFKDIGMEGQSYKKRCIHTFVNATMSKHKKMYLSWAEKTKTMNIVKSCKIVDNVFNMISLTLNGSLALIMQDQTQIKIKQNAIDKIFKNCDFNYKNAYNNWKDKTQILNMQAKINNQKKIQLIEIVERIYKSSFYGIVKNIIEKFNKNFRIKDVQRKFLNKLLNTKGGRAALAYKTWNQMPQPDDPYLRKIANKFEKGLGGFAHRSMRETLNQFKELSIEGQSTKKNCVHKLIIMTMSSNKRMFLFWAATTKRDNVVTTCKLISNVFGLANFTVSSNMALVLQNQQEVRLKQQALNQIFKNMHLNYSSAYVNWRQTSKILTLQKKINQEKKMQMIEMLERFTSGGIQEKIKEAVQMFAKNFRILDIQRKFFLKLLNTKGGRAALAYKIWNEMPEPDDPYLRKIANKFEQGLGGFAHRFMRETLNPFKELSIEAESSKKNCVHKLIITTMSSNKRMFLFWAATTKRDNVVTTCKLISNVFGLANFTVSSNMALVLQNQQEVRLKQQALNQIFKNMHLNYSSAYVNWRQTSKILTLQKKINQEKKMQMIEMLERFTSGGIQEKIKEAVQMFAKNFRILEIQRKFFLKLLNTKGGRAALAYKIWNEMPQPDDPYLRKIANKFEQGLGGFAHRFMRETLNPFKELSIEAESSKKNCVHKLIITTMSSNKRMFLFWAATTKRDNVVTTCKLISNIFGLANFTVSSNMALVLQNQQEVRLKQQALNQIFKNMHLNYSSAYVNWRQISKILTLQKKINQEKKMQMIEMLERFTSGGIQEKIKEAVQMFAKNFRILDIQRKFFLKLLNTKGGRAALAYKIWNEMPEPDDPYLRKIANKFEQGLGGFAHRFMRETLNPFKELSIEAESSKKNCVHKLIITTMSSNKRMFLFWAATTKRDNVVTTCKLISNVFGLANFTVSSNMALVLQNQQEVRLKQQALNQIFKNMHLNYSSAYVNWRQTSKILTLQKKINQEKKMQMIEMLERFTSGGIQEKIKEAVQMFAKNFRILEIQRKFFLKLLNTKGGRAALAYKIWNEMPEPDDPYLRKIANKFEQGLGGFAHRFIRETLNPFKELSIEAESSKKNCVHKLIITTMSSNKRMFLFWAATTKRDNVVTTCNLISNIFQLVNFTVSSNSSLILHNENELLLKQNTMNQIFKNMHLNFSSAFSLWNQRARILTLQNIIIQQKKMQMISLLQTFTTFGLHGQIKNTLDLFFKNSRISDIQRKFFLRLFNTKSGLTILAYQRWKQLPQIEDPFTLKLANKFQQGLINLVRIKFRQCINKFLQLGIQGDTCKKRCIQQLVHLTMSSNNKYFLYWHNISRRSMVVQSCRNVFALFNTFSTVVSTSVSILFEDPHECQLKQKTLDRLFKHTSLRIKTTFELWRDINMQQKIKELIDSGQKLKMISRLQTSVSRGLYADLTKIFYKFYLNYKISNIHLKFFKKIFQTKFFGILSIFNQWKTIPEQDLGTKRLAIIFQKGLGKFIHKFMKETFTPFKDQNDLALLKLKQIGRILILKTMSNNRRLFYFWVNQTKHNKIIVSCRLCKQFMDTLNNTIANNANLAIGNIRQKKILEYSLDKIFDNAKHNVSNFLSIWKKQVDKERIEEGISKEQRKFIISKLQMFLSQSKKGQIKNTLDKFATNFMIEETKTKYIKKILNSGIGKTLILFNLWKTLPTPKDSIKIKLAHKFEKSLIHLYKNRLEFTIRKYTDISSEGEGKKKYCVSKLINLTMSEYKRKYIKWKQQTKKNNLIFSCKMTILNFENLNTLLCGNVKIILQNEAQAKLKQKIIDKIFLNLEINEKDVFFLWREKARIMNLQIKIGNTQKQEYIRMLQKFTKGGILSQIKNVVNQFNKNYRISEIQKKFFLKLFNSKGGRVVLAFMLWKQMPEPDDPYLLRIANKFQKGLGGFAYKIMKETFQPFKEMLNEGEANKKRCINRLVLKTMSSNKRMFLFWSGTTKRDKIVSTCKQISKIFELSNLTFKSNVGLLLQNQQDMKLKQKALKEMFRNIALNYTSGFFLWKQKSRILTLLMQIDKDKKKQLIEILQRFAHGGFRQQLRNTYQMFLKNGRILEIQKKFFLKLLATKGGREALSFKTWTQLPEIQDPYIRKIANKFQKGLGGFAHRLMRETLNPFREAQIEGDIKKKRCVHKIINMTMSANKRMFLFWVSVTKRDEVVKTCKNINNIFQLANFTIRSNIAMVFQNQEEIKLKQNALERITRNLCMNLNSAFGGWREKSKILTLQKEINQEKKIKMIEILEKFASGGVNKNIQQALEMFKKNYRIVDIHRKFFMRILNTKGGKVALVLKTWKEMPEPDDPYLRKIANKFQQGLGGFAHRFMRETLNPFKELSIEGQSTKKNCVHKLIITTMSANKRMFLFWAATTKRDNVVTTCKLISNVFGLANFTVSSNMALVLQNQQEVRLKQQALNQIFKNMHLNYSSAYVNWRQTSKILTLQKKINQQKKMQMIEMLERFTSGGIQEKIKEAVQMFAKNFRILDVQRKFFIKLLNTKGGRAALAYKIWKEMPEPDDPYLRKLANKFEQGLGGFAHRFMRETLNPFKELSIEGQSTKKNCVHKLIITTMSANKRMFLFWAATTKRDNVVTTCKLISNVFGLANFTVSSNMALVLQNQQEVRLKQQALNQIFKNMHLNYSSAYVNWRQTSKILTLQNKINQEKKMQMIEMLERFTSGGIQEKIKESVQMFAKNFRILDVQRKFFIKLLNTKGGRAALAYKIWKEMPEPDDPYLRKIANKFEQGLGGFAHRFMRETLNPFKELSIEGQSTKKNCVHKLIITTMSANKRMFLFWAATTKRDNVVTTCKLISNVFGLANFTVSSNMALVLQNQQEVRLKQQALNQIFKNMHLNYSSAYVNWRQTSKILTLQKKINQEKKMQMIEMLERFTSGGIQEKIKEAVQMFAKNFRILDVQRKFFIKLLNTKGGRAALAYKIWKEMPEPDDPYLRKLANKFEQGLGGFAHRFMRETLNPFKELSIEGQSTKKNCVHKLIITTMSANKRMFLFWATTTKRDNVVTTCKLISNVFGLANFTVSSNMALVLQNQQEVRLKQQALNQIFKNMHLNYSSAYVNWRQTSKILTLQKKINQEKKMQMIEMLERFTSGGIHEKIKQAVQMFAKNFRILDVQRKFFIKLLNTKGGRAALAYKIWKEMPEPDDPYLRKLANKFEQGLGGFAHRFMRETLNPFKELSIEGQSTKKNCVHKLIITTMSANKRMFLFWAATTKRDNVVTTCKLISNVFGLANFTVISNMALVLQNQQEVRLKQQTLNQIFKNMHLNYSSAYVNWRQTSKILTLQNKINQEKKMQMIEMLERFTSGGIQEKIKESVQMFAKNFRILEIQRKFFLKLLNTKGGRAALAYKIWNEMPEHDDPYILKLANKFEQSLVSFVHRFLRNTLVPFKDLSLQGSSSKKRCVHKLINTTMAANKRMFIFWELITKRDKIIFSCNLCITSFQSLVNVFSTSLTQVFEDPQSIKKRENALNRLFANAHQNQFYAFKNWKQQSDVIGLCKQISNQKRRNYIQIMEDFLFGGIHTKIQEVLNKFLKHSRIILIQRNFFLKLLTTNSGKAAFGFHLWKQMPQMPDLFMVKLANEFEQGLKKFVNRRFGQPYREMKQLYFEGDRKKKGAAILMTKLTMSAHQRIFNRWHQISIELKVIEILMLFFSLFKDTNKDISDNVKQIYDKSNLTNRKKIQKLIKIISPKYIVLEKNAFTNIHVTPLIDMMNRWKENYLLANMGTKILKLLTTKHLKMTQFGIKKWKQFKGKLNQILKGQYIILNFTNKRYKYGFDLMNKVSMSIKYSKLSRFMDRTQRILTSRLKQFFVFCKNSFMKHDKIIVKLENLRRIVCMNSYMEAFDKLDQAKLKYQKFLYLTASIYRKNYSENLSYFYNNWASKNEKITLKKVFNISNKKIRQVKINAFKIWKKNISIVRLVQKIMGLLEMQKIIYWVQDKILGLAFNNWKANIQQNPWIKICLIRLALLPNVNTQIALWRLVSSKK